MSPNGEREIAVDFDDERDLLGDAVQRQFTVDHEPVAVHTDARGAVGELGMLIDVEEVGRANVRVATFVAGVDQREVDGGLDETAARRGRW